MQLCLLFVRIEFTWGQLPFLNSLPSVCKSELINQKQSVWSSRPAGKGEKHWRVSRVWFQWQGHLEALLSYSFASFVETCQLLAELSPCLVFCTEIMHKKDKLLLWCDLSWVIKAKMWRTHSFLGEISPLCPCHLLHSLFHPCGHSSCLFFVARKGNFFFLFFFLKRNKRISIYIFWEVVFLAPKHLEYIS